MTTAGNVADLVSAAATRGPDHLALIDAGTGATLTWSAVDAAVNGQARRLVEAGARPGDRVAVRLPTGFEFCVSVLGALRAGCVVVPIAPGAPARELRRVLTNSGATLLVGAGEGSAEDTGEDTGEDTAVTVLEPSLAAGEPVEPVNGGEDLAVLGYTSGTSGVPRGAMLSHRALLANAAQCAALRPAPVTAADRVLLALPLFHVYGLGPGLLQVAAAGATGVLLERFAPEHALEVVERHRVTTIVGVPPMYHALLALPEERLRDGLATVRLLTSGAAPLAATVLAAVTRVTGLPVYEGYGLTETGPVLTSTLVTGRPKPGSVGR